MSRPRSRILFIGVAALRIVLAGPGSVLAQGGIEAGVRLFENGQFAAARRVFASAVRDNPHDAVAAFYLGRTFFAEENYDHAVRWLEQAVERDGGNAEYHLWLGRAYGHQAMRASVWRQFFLARKVKAHFEKAVELDPDNTAARLDLVEYYLKAPGFLGGSAEKARAQAEEIKRRDAERGREAEEMLAAAEWYKQQVKNE